MNNKKKLPIIITITSTIILIIHFINKLIFRNAVKKELLFSENSNYYNWRFGKIHYKKSGHGKPLLLIHDLNHFSSSYEWREVINLYSKDYTVYAIDLLGCGKSDKANITYTNYLFVQLISDFIKNVIKQKTNVMATGQICSSVIMSCHLNKNLYHNLIFINPPDINKQNKYPGSKDKLLKYFLESPILGTTLYNIYSRKTLIHKAFHSSYYYNQNLIKKKTVNAYYESAHVNGFISKYLFTSIFTHYTNINIVHALKEINNNLCILSGEYDEHRDLINEDYLSINPAIEISTIKDTKYLPQLECPFLVYQQSLIYLEY